jgi:phosphoacetylglucosamine mutase
MRNEVYEHHARAFEEETSPGVVFLGQDTRKSSARLAAVVRTVAQSLGVQLTQFNEVATPMLYFFVQQNNKKVQENGEIYTRDKLIDLYFDSYGTRFKRLYAQINEENGSKDEGKVRLVVDCSNGIGYQSAIRFYQCYLKEFFDLTFINQNNVDLLNSGCGAEHVHKEGKLPANFPVDSAKEGLSFDGDADRLVYFRNLAKDGSAQRIDGDKQSALLVLGIQKFMAEYFPTVEHTFGVVMTPYSNFGLVNLLKSRNIPFYVTPTGVKYTHRKANEFEIGVYFESNGHGTLLFQETLLKRIADTPCLKDRGFALEFAQFVNNVC